LRASGHRRSLAVTCGSWAAGALYALGQINFLFDRSQQPHLTADQLAVQLDVVKTTMANKATTIRRTLDLGYYEPGLTRQSLYHDPPLASTPSGECPFSRHETAVWRVCPAPFVGSVDPGQGPSGRT
jgi:hypothetical protein